MICRTCRLSLRALRTPSQPLRTLSLRPYSTPSTSTSTSTSSSEQPFPDAPSDPVSAPKATSSCPAGTPMLGLNYFKNKPDVIAGEDAEYPAWLWGLLDKGKKKGVAGSEIDTSTMNRKQRKRHEKKLAARRAAQPKTIPLHEQALDITPAGEASASAEEGIKARRAITKSAREARRKAIKEENFLKGM